MSSAAKGGLAGAFVGFVVIVGIMVLQVQSPAVIHALWPLRGVRSLGNGAGQLSKMIFLTLGFFSNVALYAGVGYGLGWLISRGGTQQ